MGMGLLSLLRESRGLSQRGLAKRAGVAYKTVQLLESGRHNPRWSTLLRLAEAMDMPTLELARVLQPCSPETLRDATTRISGSGARSWATYLYDFVDDFRRDPSAALVADAPDPRTDPRILALAAASVEWLCAQAAMAAPWWCSGVPSLDEPWFPAEVEDLKASALVESPAQFRQRNIFVLGNFLFRV